MRRSAVSFAVLVYLAYVRLCCICVDSFIGREPCGSLLVVIDIVVPIYCHIPQVREGHRLGLLPQLPL